MCQVVSKEASKEGPFWSLRSARRTVLHSAIKEAWLRDIEHCMSMLLGTKSFLGSQ